jgi:hypothetical protein
VKSEELKVSSPADFKKDSRKIIQTPSGFVVEIKKIDVLGVFARTGFLPAFLGTEGTEVDIAKLFQQNPSGLMNFFNMVLLEGIARPTITDKPYDQVGEDEVHISDIPFEDRMFLQNAILEFNGMTATQTERLNNFREGQADSSDSGQNSKKVRKAST